jgi:membrane-associated phospholipid phosphatase
VFKIVELLGKFSPLIIIIIVLTKYYSSNDINQLRILVLLLMDFIIINPSLKLFMGAIGFKYERPMYGESYKVTSLKQFDMLGMPSGHVEINALYLSYLYHYARTENIMGIPGVWFMLLLTLITSYQRVISGRHTILQVIVGFGVGWILGKVSK